MKKILVRTLCILLCVLLCPVFLVSCGNETVLALGPYEIKEDHFRYLAGMYNRKILTSMGIYGSPWSATDPTTGITVGQAVDSQYTASFLKSVYTLLYSQLLFDVYDLDFPSEMEQMIEENVSTIVNYYGKYSEQRFDDIAKDYGFSADTLREVYTMQTKQTLVVNHLFGENGEKIEPEKLDKLYTDNYICFQTIVINNKYKIVKETNDKGESVDVLEDLTDLEKKERNDIIDDLTNLFITDKESEEYKSYVYKVIDPTRSYNELYSMYSDDKAYPNGCYSVNPKTVSVQSAITAASLLKENDVARVKAKRYFVQGGTVEIGGKKETINAGDYFEYGYVFVQRLPLEEKAYEKEEFKDFFGSFISDSIYSLFMDFLADYEANESSYTLEEFSIIDDIPLSSVTPNNLDYNFINGEITESDK